MKIWEKLLEIDSLVDIDELLHDLDEFDREAVRFLVSDETWKWIMEKEDFNQLLSEYQNRCNTANGKTRLGDVMKFKDPAAHFSKYRNGTIKRTSALRIYCLAAELDSVCKKTLKPTDFARPDSTKEKEKASLETMTHLWELPEYKSKTIKAIPDMLVALHKQGVPASSEFVLDSLLKSIRLKFRKLNHAILAPYLWLRSETTFVKILAGLGGIIGTAIIFAGVRIMSGSESDPNNTADSGSSSVVYSDNVDVSDALKDGRKETAKGNVSKDGESVTEINGETKGSDLIHTNLVRIEATDTEKEETNSPNAIIGRLQIGVNVPHGAYTIKNKDDKIVGLIKNASGCGPLKKPGGRFICQHSLPVGLYNIVFENPTGYISPDDIRVDLPSTGAFYTADYSLRDEIETPRVGIETGTLRVGLNDTAAGGFTVYSTNNLVSPIMDSVNCIPGFDNDGYYCTKYNLPSGAYVVFFGDTPSGYTLTVTEDGVKQAFARTDNSVAIQLAKDGINLLGIYTMDPTGQ